MQPNDSQVTIREFEPGDEAAFYRLNEEWINRYFEMEQHDEEQLLHPRREILAGGGRIFLAIHNGIPVGTCALVAIGPREYEVVKMAVTEACRGTGLGRALLARTIQEAQAAGATRLSLETNSNLSPAIRLYESMGFRHLPPERIPSSPYTRANVFMELLLNQPAGACRAGS